MNQIAEMQARSLLILGLMGGRALDVDLSYAYIAQMSRLAKRGYVFIVTHGQHKAFFLTELGWRYCLRNSKPAKSPVYQLLKKLHKECNNEQVDFSSGTVKCRGGKFKIIGKFPM